MEHPILVEIYNNIYEFINKNKLRPIDDKISDNKKFYETINSRKFINIACISNKIKEEEEEEIKNNIDIFAKYNNKESISVDDIKSKHNITGKLHKIVYILLLHNESEYDSRTANFKILINMIKYPNCNIITISNNPLSTHVKRQITELSNETKKIFNYTYNKFKILVNNHTLCSPHTILTEDEEYDLLNNILKKKKSHLPKIRLSDPQNVWIGGEIGNIIKIDRDSEITGKSTYYRVVINN